MIPSKPLLNNILTASCSVQYKPQSYKTEPAGRGGKVFNSKLHSTNAYQSLSTSEPDLGKDKKIYVSTHYSKTIFEWL